MKTLYKIVAAPLYVGAFIAFLVAGIVFCAALFTIEMIGMALDYLGNKVYRDKAL